MKREERTAAIMTALNLQAAGLDTSGVAGNMGIGWQEADWLLGLGRYRARVAVREAVRSGQIESRAACEECSAEVPSLHRHHSDYRRPLDVRWLCPPCHRAEHTRSNREAARRYRARQEAKLPPKEEPTG